MSTPLTEAGRPLAALAVTEIVADVDWVPVLDPVSVMALMTGAANVLLLSGIPRVNVGAAKPPEASVT